uniref:Uncharacterized protein n=1 Tax=Ditylum brightwellii TaxID=49249 RepID=A0A7S4T2A7_9STRA
MQSSLAKEAQFEQTKTKTKKSGFTVPLLSVALSLSTTCSFSRSQRFKRASSQSVSTNCVSFESCAICSEYEASFSPYTEQELGPLYKSALGGLPVPSDKENPPHELIYGNFITAYVKKLVLGGKRITTTQMNAQDYAGLVLEEVDVAQTMSFEMTSAMGATASANAGLVKDNTWTRNNKQNRKK